MRHIILCGLTLTLLLLVSTSHAGLVHRRFRAALQPQLTSAAIATSDAELHKDQIPVTVIQDGQTVASQSEQLNVLEVAAAPAVPPIVTEAAATEAAAIAEDIANAVETEQNLRVINAIMEAERQQEAQIVQQQINEAIQEQNKELLQAATALTDAPAIAQQQIATEITEPIKLATAAAETASPLAVESLPAESDIKLKAVPVAVNSDAAVAEPNELVQASAPVADEQVSVVVAVDGSSVRQVTQATPTQSTTPQNFVQQLIQNSPLGQLFNQLTGQQQQQQQQAAQQTTQLAQAGQVAADEPVAPATPAPTLPGFLNPQNAITQAQQVVQNAAQSVVNATTQAFQGVQQLASQIGTQFQNTLSSLGGQQQQSTADSTTTRPPGPIQSILSNFVGGGANQQSAAGATAAPPQPGQQQGPLQGIFSFFQGGNRPQNTAGSTSGTVVAAGVPPAAVSTIVSAGPAQIDDKVDVKKDEVLDQEVEQSLEKEQEQQQLQAQLAQSADTYGAGEGEDNTNEVRNSAEVGLDSLEDTHPEELIVVNENGNQQGDVIA